MRISFVILLVAALFTTTACNSVDASLLLNETARGMVRDFYGSDENVGFAAAGLPELGLGGTNRPTDTITLQAVATIGQTALMEVYRDALATHDLVAGQVLLVPLDFIVRTQYVHAGQTLVRLLELGVVPVVNENDAIADDEILAADPDIEATLTVEPFASWPDSAQRQLVGSLEWEAFGIVAGTLPAGDPIFEPASPAIGSPEWWQGVVS